MIFFLMQHFCIANDLLTNLYIVIHFVHPWTVLENHDMII